MKKDRMKKVAESLKGLGGTPEGWECCFLFIADIARQLTRIADQGERLKTAEMLLCRIDKTDFADCKSKEGFLHIDVPSSLTKEIHRFCETVNTETFGAAMQILNQDHKPTPPDALVEAVGRFIKENVLTKAALDARRAAGKKTIDVSIAEVKKLITTHKKAGDSNAT